MMKQHFNCFLIRKSKSMSRPADVSLKVVKALVKANMMSSPL